jgi:hypothetical protein
MSSVLQGIRDDVHLDDVPLIDWVQSVVFHRADERFGPAAVQEACDGLAATLQDVSVSQHDFFRTMTELSFLGRVIERRIADIARECGLTRDVQVAQEALCRLSAHLTRVQPQVLSPFWTAAYACAVRLELERAVWELHYALLVLHWSTAERIPRVRERNVGT